jgi:hypothetical protein
MGRRRACCGLAALLVAALAACSAAQQHTWLPLHSSEPDSTAGAASGGARQLASMTSRLRLRDRRGGHPASAQAAGCREAGSERDARLPILVIGLRHRWEERLAKFLLALRWYEDLHVVEAVDGRTLDPVGDMTSGEVR